MGLTKTPCAEHVRRLERSGVIRGSRAELAPEAMGVDHIVMVQVLLNSATALDLRLVNFVAQQIGGKGGGKPDMAIAGGSDAAALPAALASVPGWIGQRL